MPHRPARLVSALSGLALVSSLSLVSSGPAAAEPSIGEVKDRVDRLYHEAEIASERYNDARLELSAMREDLSSLRADQRRAARRVEQVREQVRESVLRDLQGQDLSAVGQVVVSDDPSAFLSQMSTMSAYQQVQQGLFADYATEQKALSLRSEATARRTAQVRSVERDLAEEKATIDTKLDEATALLDRLEAQERARIAAAAEARAQEQARREAARRAAAERSRPTVSRSRTTSSAGAAAEPAAPAPAAASGSASAAVSYALAQVGKSYVYGAAGPSAFDCSGLTMQAWAAAGVGLPHSSTAQMSSGASVSSSALQPGDLVFYYSPVSHVGIYIGGGRVVHAANPSTGVGIAPVFSMPFSGAVRPG